MISIELTAPAKINLYLEATGRLSNGYHALQTSMHTVSLFDSLILTLTSPTEGITMSCDNADVPVGEDNLVCRAARHFMTAFGVHHGVHIDLIKRIPPGGGLGGGSADAGAVLRGLDQLCGTMIPVHVLTALGAHFGADIPFCVVGGSFSAEGFGEILTPSTPLPNCTIVVVQGRSPISTPEAFARLDRIGRVVKQRNPMPALLASGDLTQIAGHLYNAFEAIVPTCREAKDLLLCNGALGALMSGSGSAVYGLFAPDTDHSAACLALARRGYSAFVCHPL